MKSWNFGNMESSFAKATDDKLWKYGNGRASRPMSRVMAALVACTLAQCAAYAAPATRNIAFRRVPYESSAADYTNVGHLATDGKVTDDPVWLLKANSEFPNKSPAREMPQKAIDGNKDTKWLVTESKCWLEVALLAPARAASYAIMSANDVPDRDPKKWRILGSNDGATFEEIAAAENPGFAKRHECKTWEIDKPGTYRFYRLAIDANSGAPETQLAEFDLLDDAGNSIIRRSSSSFQSRWISKTGTNEWLKVDLGAMSRVDSVSVKWAKGGEAESSYIELSADGEAWTRGTSGKDIRFVKLVCEKAKGEVFGVDEIEVMGYNALKVASVPLPRPGIMALALFGNAVFLAFIALVCWGVEALWNKLFFPRTDRRPFPPHGAMPAARALKFTTIHMSWIVLATFTVSTALTVFFRCFDIELPPQDPTLWFADLACPWTTRLFIALFSVIAAPIVEEFIFRRFVFRAILRGIPGVPPLACLLSGVVFAVIHYNLAAFLPIVFLGTVLAWVYWRTGRLWTTMLMHSVVNATSFLLLLVFHEMVG